MLELEPKSPAARECLFRAYVNKGDHTNALKIHRERMVQWGASPEELKALDTAEPSVTLEGRFRKDLSWMKRSASKGERVWTMYAAWLSVRLGETGQAFEWLEKSRSERSPLLLYINIDPAWDSLKSDPRFSRFSY